MQRIWCKIGDVSTVKKAHDNGGDWCSYGWSDGQMALFPTQESKWQEFQAVDGHEHDCGRPGINGGYIDNPNINFGKNCYGYKPDMKLSDVSYMSSGNTAKRETKFDKQVNEWKEKYQT